MEELRVSYELNKLSDLIDERNVLVESLNMQPSANDNVNLKLQLDKTLNILNSIDISNLSEQALESLRESVTKYNLLLMKIPDFDQNMYKFTKDIKRDEVIEHNSPSDPSTKKVRFQEDVETSEVEENMEPLPMEFQPYHDYENEPVPDAATAKTAVANAIINSVSNEELFARQQQQLMDQDTHLDHLSSSINRTHGISLDINREVEEQNNELLYDLENLIDNSHRNLNRAKRRLEIFERTARENGPCSIIVLLIIILLLLLIVF